jgi:hypothetical protein
MKTKIQNDGRRSQDDAERKTTLVNLHRVGLRKGEAEIREDGEVIIRGRWTYVGRKNLRFGIPASRWGNPYCLGRDGTRENLVMHYKVHIFYEPELLGLVHILKGRTLACWCAPKLCHGEILIRLAEAAFEMKEAGEQVTKGLLFAKAGFGERWNDDEV